MTLAAGRDEPMPTRPVVDPLDAALARLGPVEGVVSRSSNAFGAVARGVTRVVIAGCGYLGRLALGGARSAGLEVVAFADNNPALWGSPLEGIPVLSPARAAELYGHDAVFVAAIYNGTPLRRQLSDLGCERVVAYPMFFWAMSKFMPAEDRLELPGWILERLDDIRQGYRLLSDDRSRREFAAQIAWRCSLDYALLPGPDPAADMYFSPDVFRLSDDEVMVDCGAFDGDSIRMFLNKSSGQFRAIYAFEPDAGNLTALRRYVAGLPDAVRDRIVVLPFGASDHAGRVSFDASGTPGARMTTTGTATIECRRLDDVSMAAAPTIVKMDIEGEEPLALRGALDTIRRSAPILAVCAYHRSEHLWTLPAIIAAALPRYRIFLRRYAEECWETVYYAVPPARVTSQPDTAVRPA